MANYYASARTNYFELKNMDAFKEEMSNYGVEVSEKHGTEMVCLLGNDPDSGCFPSYNCETDEEVDFPQVVAPFLKNGWVAIFMEAGAE